jgi:sulfur-carrier protein
MLQILVFGQLTDIIGESNISIDFVPNVSELKSALNTLYPTLKDKTFTIALDNKIMPDDAEIKVGSVIALLPPFSGG